MATGAWGGFGRSLAILLAGFALSVGGIVLFSHIGLHKNVASVLVAISLLPALMAVVLGQVRLRNAAMQTPGGREWRTLPLTLRVAPLAVFLMAVPVALALRAEDAPRYWRTVTLAGFAVAAVLTQRLIRHRTSGPRE